MNPYKVLVANLQSTGDPTLPAVFPPLGWNGPTTAGDMDAALLHLYVTLPTPRGAS